MKILLVEDEKYLAEAVAQVLRKNNYTVDLACDGEAGLDAALSQVYDIIVLDIMLPRLDGLTLLWRLRKEKIKAPVLLLSARGATEDKVIGLDAGADDYLAKPYKVDELLARLRALGRRKGEFLAEGVLVFGDLELNPHTLLLYCQPKSFKLTLKESQLLELLIKMRGAVASKGTIIEKLWGFEGVAEDNHVEVYVSFLRKKLSSLGSKTAIKTIRGRGYALCATGGEEA